MWPICSESTSGVLCVPKRLAAFLSPKGEPRSSLPIDRSLFGTGQRKLHRFLAIASPFTLIIALPIAYSTYRCYQFRGRLRGFPNQYQFLYADSSIRSSKGEYFMKVVSKPHSYVVSLGIRYLKNELSSSQSADL